MPQSFQVVLSPAFERDARRITRGNPETVDLLEKWIAVLEEDPYSHTRQYDIRKLTGVKPGKGQWRIRQGDYRLRYDIFRPDVVLYSLRHRKEAY